jgi:hypothetical protein
MWELCTVSKSVDTIYDGIDLGYHAEVVMDVDEGDYSRCRRYFSDRGLMYLP